MRARNRFASSGVFTCQCCGHRTRESGQDDDRFCAPCYDLLGMQNTLWDDGLERNADWLPRERDNILAGIAKRGGSVDKVKAYMTDLFNPEAYEAKAAARRAAQ